MVIEVEEIEEKLKMFGYNAEDSDKVLILFEIKSVEEHIKNYCNVREIPDGLYYTALGMIIGEFLKSKYSVGCLDIESLDFDTAVKSITEGDVNVTYAISDGSSTDEQKFNALVSQLTDTEKSLIRYRKLVW